MEIELLQASSSNAKSLGKHTFHPSTTVANVKRKVHQITSKLYPDRQSIRLELKGKSLKDTDTLDALNLANGGKLYVKDLGPQIGWKTVFLAEYAGPLAVYLWIYQRPWIFYGTTDGPVSVATHLAAACWTLHYAKRLLETIFVHRFSHSTMPIGNLFKNCSYYWGFAAYVSYHINHPLYTSPCQYQSYVGLGLFLLCEFGNLATHIAFRNLRPAGSKVRKIPQPDSNPMTKLFRLVSCPNYTYEVGAWLSFSLMTQCIPALLFALAGFYQMGIWALGKHRNYRKEFKDYPKSRKAIVPFVL